MIRQLIGYIGKGMMPRGIYIISYPKTGRTWLRALIGKSLAEKYNLPENMLLKTEFMAAASGIPVTEFTHDGSEMTSATPYSDLSVDKSKYRRKKVILLGRNVKDTVVSAYFQATKRIGAFSGPISEFIRDERFGIRKILTFYRIWHDNMDVPKDFMFIRYEDLHENAHTVLADTLTFLGKTDISDEIINKAVDYCSFQNMKKAEKENRFNTSILKAKSSDDPESYKVRKGKVGNYDEYLSHEDISYIDKLIDEYGCEFTR